jgi:hypothetical protein
MHSFTFEKSYSFPRSASVLVSHQQPSFFLRALLFALVMLPWTLTVHAQDTQAIPDAPEVREKFDVSVGGFYQVTNASNGNFIREDTTESGGGLVGFRQPYRPWFGYEANVGYTKFYEAYNKGVVKLEDNVIDFNVAYLLQSPTYYGFQAFFSLGGGVIVFRPIAGTITSQGTLPTNLPTQALPDFAYTLGLNYPVTKHLGARGQLRSLSYKTPDFHQDSLNTHTLRTSYEPTLSVYYRF